MKDSRSIKELSATDAHLDNIKYKVCCPMWDNKKCVKGTLGCEAEQWKRKKKMNIEKYNAEK